MESYQAYLELANELVELEGTRVELEASEKARGMGSLRAKIRKNLNEAGKLKVQAKRDMR